MNVTEPSAVHSIKDKIIGKSVHTNNGVLVGNIDDIYNDSVVVKGNIVSTVYYHIPIQKVKEWDGHALWLTIDDKESKMHIMPSQDGTAATWTDPIDLELDEGTLCQVAKEAERHGISPNSYINQILKRYLEWDKFEPKADIVPISKPVAKELFDNLSEQQIISMAKNTAKNALQNSVVKFESEQQQQKEEVVKKKLDTSSFLSWLENEMNSYAIEIRHIVSKDHGSNDDDNSTSDNGTSHNYGVHHKYILKHDAGYNYSLYYKAVLESIFDKVLQKHIVSKITNTMLTFEFEDE